MRRRPHSFIEKGNMRRMHNADTDANIANSAEERKLERRRERH